MSNQLRDFNGDHVDPIKPSCKKYKTIAITAGSAVVKQSVAQGNFTNDVVCVW